MPWNDLMTPLSGYPDATAPAAIEQAVAFAQMTGAKLTAVAVNVRIPLKGGWIPNYLLDMPQFVREAEAQSASGCRAALDDFSAKASAAGVNHAQLLETCDLYGVADHVAHRARTHDLCLAPVTGAPGGTATAEAVIFGSGRPVVVFDAARARFDGGVLNEVAVAWDGSRGASRALADALPILRLARGVRVLTVVGEKPSARTGLGRDVVRHLSLHGVVAELDEADAAGRSIGQVLDDYLGQRRPDLVVMGAFGHSRTREFILGGATMHMLRTTPAPLLMSH